MKLSLSMRKLKTISSASINHQNLLKHSYHKLGYLNHSLQATVISFVHNTTPLEIQLILGNNLRCEFSNIVHDFFVIICLTF